jgi:hypothetical protein
MNEAQEVDPGIYRQAPTRRVLASNLAEAGRAIVRARDSQLQVSPVTLTQEERVELEADLNAIDEAQRIGIETGSRYIIRRAGR